MTTDTKQATCGAPGCGARATDADPFGGADVCQDHRKVYLEALGVALDRTGPNADKLDWCEHDCDQVNRGYHREEAHRERHAWRPEGRQG